MVKIGITPLAFESMGVRSMCTLVETRDVKVLVDAGVSVAPRFSLMPHPKEYATRTLVRNKIREAAGKADFITISHYHYDHHTPNYVDTVYCGSSPEEANAIYGRKTVLAKSTKDHVNMSQRRRGWLFQKISGQFVDRFEVADGRVFRVKDTELRFSQPVYHGEEGSELGWVVMLVIQREEEKVMHASDVQGPVLESTLEMILAEKPDILVIGGPPLYLSGSKVPVASIEQGLRSLQRIAKSVPITILDHHIVRSEDWRNHAAGIFEEAEKYGNRVVTAAEYAGCEYNALESTRKALYEKEPPGKEFLKWTKMSEVERKKTAPPL